MVVRKFPEEARLALVAELVGVFESAKHPVHRYNPFAGTAVRQEFEARVNRICSCLRVIGQEHRASTIADSFDEWVESSTLHFTTPQEDRDMRARGYERKSGLQKTLQRLIARGRFLEGLKEAALRFDPSLEMEVDDPPPQTTSVVDPYTKELVWEAERQQWRLTFRGKSTFWRETKPIRDLAILLQAPHQKFPAYALDGRDRAPDGKRAVVDAEGVKKAAKTVGQRHNRLMDMIVQSHQELWRYFNDTIEIGTDCRYVPPADESDWVVMPPA